jgi:hypothetical protein
VRLSSERMHSWTMPCENGKTRYVDYEPFAKSKESHACHVTCRRAPAPDNDALQLEQRPAVTNKTGGYRTHIYIGPLPSLV